MKKAIVVLLLSHLLISSCSEKNRKIDVKTTPSKNEVIVLGTIHGGHLTQPTYNTEVLSNIIKSINPDLILTEIPPDRFSIAMAEFLENDSIEEPRVIRFPEYIDVIFPLSKEMKFEIIPTAAWTKEMAENRSKKLKAIKEDKSRAAEWNEMVLAGQKSDSLIKATGKEYDPFWINSAEYDALVEIELEVYNRLFNDELGLGGWDNINAAHFDYILEALDKHQNEGKRILITYGAGHKGWFIKALKERKDITLLGLEDILDASKEN